MAELNENPDPPEALNTSTEDQMSNDTENHTEPAEIVDSLTAGALEHETDDTNVNDQQIEENEPQEVNEIIVEPPPIDESLIGHITISKECEDFSKKLFSSSSNNDKQTTGRKSRKNSLAYEAVKESFKRDRLDSLQNRFDSFVGKTTKKIEKLDTQIAIMEKPIIEE